MCGYSIAIFKYITKIVRSFDKIVHRAVKYPPPPIFIYLSNQSYVKGILRILQYVQMIDKYLRFYNHHYECSQIIIALCCYI